MSNRDYTFDLNISCEEALQEQGENNVLEDDILSYTTQEEVSIGGEGDQNNFDDYNSQENVAGRNNNIFILDLNEPPPMLDLNEPPLDDELPLNEGDQNVFENMPKRKIFNLSNETRHAIYLAMLRKSVNGKIKWGTTKAVASEFSVSMRTVQRIWKRAKHVSETYYLIGDEEEPHRTCKNKNFVLKVMFLGAIARPRFDEEGRVTFSGKIGIFPFVTKEPAKRRSANRPARTLKTKVITSVGRDIIRSYFIEKLVPEIIAKWPDINGSTVFIQQDNARTHLDPNDAEFCQAVSQQGVDIRLMYQPANSPDLNILDLGFFSAIQALRYKESSKTIDELIDAVETAYEAFSPKLSNRIFCTLQQCMVEILKVRGSNKYSIPHIKKNIFERHGQLPCQLQCDAKLVEDAFMYLSTNN